MGLVGGQNCCRRKISRRAARVWECRIIFVISLLLLLLLLLLTSLVMTALITLMSQPTDNSHSNHSTPIVKNTMLFNQISALASAHLFRSVPHLWIVFLKRLWLREASRTKRFWFWFTRSFLTEEITTFTLYWNYKSALNSQMRKSGHITTTDVIQIINERLIIPHQRNLPQKLERFQRGFIELRIAQNVDGKLFSCLSTRPTEQIPGKQSFSTHSYLFQNSPFSLGIHSEKQ